MLRHLQGWYYLLGGLWPFGQWRSFIKVAGPKPDRFQTEITAGLFGACGVTLIAGDTDQNDLLSATTALTCIVVDHRHRRDIRPIFTADKALNILFLISAIARFVRRQSSREESARLSQRQSEVEVGRPSRLEPTERHLSHDYAQS
jgi:hypothetical protein